jgi:hypothetical protein
MHTHTHTQTNAQTHKFTTQTFTWMMMDGPRWARKGSPCARPEARPKIKCVALSSDSSMWYHIHHMSTESYRFLAQVALGSVNEEIALVDDHVSSASVERYGDLVARLAADLETSAFMASIQEAFQRASVLASAVMLWSTGSLEFISHRYRCMYACIDCRLCLFTKGGLHSV